MIVAKDIGKIEGDVKDFVEESIDEFSDKNVYGVFYGYDKVFIFQIVDNDFVLPKGCEINNKLHEMRVFNKEGEIYIYRVNDELRYRIRIDEDKSEEKDFEYHLWGKVKGDSVVEKDRGIKIPLTDALSQKFSGKKMKVVIKNYYDFDENGKLFFYDARFIGFEGV